MTHIGDSFVFSSESVSEGHPDKLADRISDRVLDHFLAQHPKSRVACETLVTHGFVCIAGEVRSERGVDKGEIERLAREVIRDTGYDGFDARFTHATAQIDIRLQPQAFEIAAAVDKAGAEHQGAGDQGLMFGYASDETASLMPAPITYAHAIVRELARARKAKEVAWLRPDGKSQVSIRYEDARPVEMMRTVVSTQHAPDVPQAKIREYVNDVLLPTVLPAEFLPKGWHDRVLVNPSGAFTEGGPATDTGLTGRKIIVDTYGGFARHGGGAFSGKDPSKVDRSAAYAARWVAKNIVAAGLAARCEVQLAYAIGVKEPVSVMVETFGTSRLTRAELDRRVRAAFDLTPFGIARDLELERPIYYATAAYGHFGRTPGEDGGSFSWERPSRVEQLKG
ncbi:MAG TPA: methionine adenosyltransferase [Gemmatimonadaceae bacterium]|nr:methionine adenosyltransferase [Gemmatimonadaceae bacterium]